MGDVIVYAVGLVGIAILAVSIGGMVIRALIAAMAAFAHLVIVGGVAAVFIWVILQMMK